MNTVNDRGTSVPTRTTETDLPQFTWEEMDVFCAYESLAAALAQVLPHFVNTRFQHFSSARHHLFAYRTVEMDDDQFGVVSYTDAHEEVWTANVSVIHRRLNRARTIRDVLSTATEQRSARCSITTALVHPCQPGASGARLQAAVALWWQARLGEGHDPQSARTMLGLTLPLITLRMLDFADADAAAPVLRV